MKIIISIEFHIILVVIAIIIFVVENVLKAKKKKYIYSKDNVPRLL